MANKVLALLMVFAVAGVALGSLWLSTPGDADASEHSATRSFSLSSVAPGEEFTVTIQAESYGRIGNIVETLPPGFTSPDADADADGRTVTKILFGAGPQTETYTVTASDTPGSYLFSGRLEDEDKDGRAILGADTVTVTAPPPTPDTDPSATRSFSAASVDPGGTLTVTIQANNYGRIGYIVETLPSGFTSPNADGQTVTIRLLSAGPQTETYTVTASDNPGSYTFSGVLAIEDKSETTVGGPSTVTVNAPPGPSARRSFSSSSVAPGGTVTVTIRADNYGGLGRILETLPSGFTSPVASGQTVTLRFLQEGPQTSSYTVTASENLGSHTFSGVLESEDKSETPVGGSSTVTVSVAPEPQVNRAPAFRRSSTTRPIVENSASGANVGAVVRATDADGDRLTYSLTGTGASSFTINSGTGQIMVGAGTTLDYETKSSYMVTVGVTDGSEDDSIDVTITVTNVVELGMVSGDATAEYAENGMDAVATYTADGPVTAGWSVSGADMDDFYISNEGVLSFASAPDFEGPADADTNNVYMVTVKAEAGGEMAMQPVTVTVTNVDEPGEVTLWAGMDALTMAPQVGETITGAVMDPDGGVTGETWQWARTTTPDMVASWMDIAGETNAAYMVAAGDTGYYLRVMATYTDAVGTDMDMEYSMPTMMVVAEAEDTLLAKYDANGNGRIDKSEVIKAINDYLFGEVGIISKADVIRLINLYLFG